MTQNNEGVSIQEMERYILDWHVTRNGHIWIDGITGGYVETMENGRYFKNAQAAIRHRVEHIKKLMAR